eukprot:m.149477 g.149477  ORF g.149477 m.149477 type:complete len:190 (+) comp14239_c0_seq7:166-735(+)
MNVMFHDLEVQFFMNELGLDDACPNIQGLGPTPSRAPPKPSAAFWLERFRYYLSERAKHDGEPVELGQQNGGIPEVAMPVQEPRCFGHGQSTALGKLAVHRREDPDPSEPPGEQQCDRVARVKLRPFPPRFLDKPPQQEEKRGALCEHYPGGQVVPLAGDNRDGDEDGNERDMVQHQQPVALPEPQPAW